MTAPGAVSRYDLNDLTRLVATFCSTDGITTADPSTITLYVKDPAGSVASYVYGAAGASVVKVGVGAYARDLSLGSWVGSWFYRWEGTGGVQAAEEHLLLVAPTFIL